MACLLVMVCPSLAFSESFRFRSIPLESALQTLAVLGKFNVIINRDVSRLPVDLVIDDARPIEALRLLCATMGVRATVVQDKDIGRVVRIDATGAPGAIARAVHPACRSITLRRTTAATQGQVILESLGRDLNLGARIVPARNRVIVWGTRAEVDSAKAIILALDR